MANDLLGSLVTLLADLGHEVGSQLSDPGARAALMVRAGVVPPAGAPPTPAGSLNRLEGLKSGGADADALQRIEELSLAMIDLVAYLQEATQVQNGDDAWNLLATFIDLVALDLLRTRRPEVVVFGQALHLISDDRILFADLFKAGDQWGSLLLGHPADDDAKADNWSLIVGAAFVALGLLVPLDNVSGDGWALDLLFGWDPEPSPPFPHAERVLSRLATLRLTHRHHLSPGGPLVEEHVGLSTVVVPPSDGGWGMFFALDLGGGITVPVGSALELALEADSPDALEAFFGDDGFVQGGLANSTAKIHLRRKQTVQDHSTIGPDDGIHLEVGRFDVGFDFARVSRFHLLVGDGALVIPKESFGFMGSVMPSSGVKLTFDADLQVDAKGKVAFAGGAGMQVVLPVNLSPSVLRVRSITIGFSLEGSDHGLAVALSAVVAFGLDFGPVFKLAVDGIGAKVAWALPSSPSPVGGPPVEHGNLGPAGNIALEFVPPRGIGIQIDAGPVKGGGFFFFDPPHRTYAGVLEASLALCGMGISVKAAGLLRETDEGWDFVLILSAQFNPAIEIFSGFCLVGVGGMVGINVAVDTDKLRAGLHDGAIGRLLFPEDPVANAPAIIATMVSVFPHRQGGIVAGPMLQLGWGRPDPFVTLSVAIVIASPAPTLLMIMGRLRITTPTPLAPIVDIKVDFLGIIDFSTPAFSFDASLVDSRVAAFTLTGDMAVRAGPAGFILSVGGFHPRFTPPADLPALRRIAIDISANPITKIRAEAYLAVTSNTFQVGLHAQLDIDAHVASVHGWLDFDALIQWEPKFHFSIHMDIGLELRVGGHSLASVSVDLLLEGPGPWHAKGSASLHLLFFTISAGFEVSWGEVDGVLLPPAINASVRVSEALSADGAWTALAPAGDSWISFRSVDRPQVPVHPYGRLSVRQQAVPLEIPITRIGRSHVVGDTATVAVTPAAGAPASAPSTGTFAMAQFIDLADDQRLSRPSFESYQDGIVFGSDAMTHPAPQPTPATYETVFLPDVRKRIPGSMSSVLLDHGLLHGSVARSGLHFATLHDGPDQRVTVAEPSYRVVVAESLTGSAQAPHAFTSSAAAFALADALGAGVLVVGAHEAVV
jgi:hypothetical protein